MASYICASRSRYEVPADKLDEAICVMQEHDDWPNDICYDAEPDGTYLVYPENGNAFGGYVRSGWTDAVDDFLRRFCVAGSYATFRDDENFMGYHLFVRNEFGVSQNYEEHLNPWDDVCDQLDDAPTAPRFVVHCGEDREPVSFHSYNAASQHVLGNCGARRRFCEAHGIEFTDAIAQQYYVEKVQRLLTCDLLTGSKHSEYRKV